MSHDQQEPKQAADSYDAPTADGAGFCLGGVAVAAAVFLHLLVRSKDHQDFFFRHVQDFSLGFLAREVGQYCGTAVVGGAVLGIVANMPGLRRGDAGTKVAAALAMGGIVATLATFAVKFGENRDDIRQEPQTETPIVTAAAPARAFDPYTTYVMG